MGKYEELKDFLANQFRRLTGVQQHFYSGKKKRHTLKSQVVVDKKTNKVICTAFSKGKKYDFKLFTLTPCSIQGPSKEGYTSMASIKHLFR